MPHSASQQMPDVRPRPREPEPQVDAFAGIVERERDAHNRWRTIIHALKQWEASPTRGLPPLVSHLLWALVRNICLRDPILFGRRAARRQADDG